MSKKIILATTVIVSAFLLSACGNNDGSAAAASNKPPQGGGNKMSMAPATPPALTDEQTAQLKAGEAAHKPTTLTFTVVGGNFFYVPTQIKVKKGDTVKIIFQDSGGVHNFNIDEYNVKIKTLHTGDSDTAQFVADKTGTFQYYCAIGEHRKLGQQGNLIVE